MMGILRQLGLFVLVLALALIGSYWWAGKDLKVLTPPERIKLQAEGLAYQFAELPGGTVHYRLEGAADRPTILLVHGFSVPSLVWAEHIEPLTGAGYRVLAFDNYGRGFSDRPQTDYTVDLTDTLIVQLLDKLEINAPVHMVGYSMGGAVTANFAYRHPERIASIALIAPAGVGAVSNSGSAKIFQLPMIGEWIARVFGNRLFTDNQVTAFSKLERADIYLPAFERQLSYRGYRRALVSTLRHYPLLDGVADTYGALGKRDIPVSSFWGGKDHLVPIAQADDLLQLIPQSNIVRFPDEGHGLVYENPEPVTQALLEHLRSENDERAR